MNLLPIAVLLGLSFVALPQDPDQAAHGERLLQTLQATGLHFEKSASGLSYKLRYDHERGRQQLVLVATTANRPADLVVHTVYTTVWTGEAPPDEALLVKVFSTTKKLGSFYVFEDGKAWAIRFSASFDATGLADGRLAAEVAAKRLKETIEFVNAVGEAMDEELNGERDIR